MTETARNKWETHEEDPHLLIESGNNHPTNTLIEDPATYYVSPSSPRPVRPLTNPDLIGAEAALKRGAAKAVARDLAAGLEPIVRTPTHLQKSPVNEKK